MTQKTNQNPWTMDVRVRERNLKSGALTDKDLEKYLASLPDLEEQVEPFAIPQPALTEQPQVVAPPPVVAAPPPVVEPEPAPVVEPVVAAVAPVEPQPEPVAPPPADPPVTDGYVEPQVAPNGEGEAT